MFDKDKHPRVLYSDVGKKDPVDEMISLACSFLAFIVSLGVLFLLAFGLLKGLL